MDHRPIHRFKSLELITKYLIYITIKNLGLMPTPVVYSVSFLLIYFIIKLILIIILYTLDI